MSQKLRKLADKYYTEYLKTLLSNYSYLIFTYEDNIDELQEIDLEISWASKYPHTRFPGVDFTHTSDLYDYLESIGYEYHFYARKSRLNYGELYEELKNIEDINIFEYLFILEHPHILRQICDNYGGINEIRKYASQDCSIFRRLDKMKTNGELQQLIIDTIKDCKILTCLHDLV